MGSVFESRGRRTRRFSNFSEIQIDRHETNLKRTFRQRTSEKVVPVRLRTTTTPHPFSSRTRHFQLREKFGCIGCVEKQNRQKIELT